MIRVVAYSRVSTEHEDQINSLNNQKQFWEEFIKKNPEWEYAGMYWDEGITGTSIKKRTGFNQMIKDAKQNKFDLILTKQVSRWARNIVDSIQTARDLKKIGVGVYFLNDNINTLDPDAELRLSIFSTLAQEESRRISENVKFGHKQAMKNGIVFGNNRVLGYDIINKKLVINQQEAEIVKKIFNWFINDNESLHGIVRKLNEQGITKGKIGGKIDHTTIKRILENEKYCGDLKQRKYYTKDYLEQKLVKNNGELDYIIIYNNHEPIISKDNWNKAQNILKERREKYNRGIGYIRHCWGGKIICGVCGDKFRRKIINMTNNNKNPVWICTTYYNKGKKGCVNGSYIREDVLEDCFRVILNELNTKEIQERVIENLQKILTKLTISDKTQDKENKIKQQIEKIRNKRDRLIELYTDNNLSKNDFNLKNNELNIQEEKLNAELNKIKEEINHIQQTKKQVVNFYNILKEKAENIKLIDDIVKDHIKEIIKYKDKIIFIFNIGNSFEISLTNYPKRSNNRDNKPYMDNKYPKQLNNPGYIPIMDNKIMYLVDRGCVRYYKSIKLEVKLAI